MNKYHYIKCHRLPDYTLVNETYEVLQSIVDQVILPINRAYGMMPLKSSTMRQKNLDYTWHMYAGAPANHNICHL